MIVMEKITVTTDTSGDATVYTGNRIHGKLLHVSYVKDDFANGVDFVITSEESLQNIWTGTNVNASVAITPRTPTHDYLGVASLYAGSGEPVEDKIPLAGERIKIVVDEGGSELSGTFIFIWDED